MNYNSTCRKNSDAGAIQSRNSQSVQTAEYQLFNPHKNKTADSVLKAVLEHPNMFAHQGYGTSARQIDHDSLLRNGSMSTTNGHRSSPSNGIPVMMPYRGKGQGDPVVERRILESEPTSTSKPCGDHAGVDWYQLSRTPPLKDLQSTMQDPKHIIPEDSNPTWVRGGIPSRTAVRAASIKRFPWDRHV